MSEYKQCPNGHYYQGDHCPYCEAKADHNYGMCEDNGLAHYGLAPTPGSKVCPNHHAYIDKDACPYCGKNEVIGSTDMHTGEGYHIIARSAKQIIKLVVDGEEFSSYDLKINYWVWDWASRIKSDYMIAMGNGESIEIHWNSDIQFGDTHMTGKEFIKMCDAIIDNQLAILGI